MWFKVKQKEKSAPLCRHWGSVQAVRSRGGVEVELYPFMTTALEGEKGWGVSISPLQLFNPRKYLVPLHRRLGGSQFRSGQVRKISPPPGFHPRTVQPAASRYSDCATGPTVVHVDMSKRFGGNCCLLLQGRRDGQWFNLKRCYNYLRK
jgi:hypothetical protein